MTADQQRTTRRRLLGGLGSTLTVGLAGCTDVLGTGPGASGDGGAPGGDGAVGTTTGSTTASSADQSPGEGTTGSATEPTTGENVRTPEGSIDPTFVAATGETGYGVPLDSAPIMGSSDATVDVYFWSDFQCPFCRKFVLRTLPTLAVNEVANGTARVVFLELPNIGDRSMQAATLGKCVWRTVQETEPSRYWDWHHAVFENQEFPDGEWSRRENLLAITEDAGVDPDAVASCLEQHSDDAEAAIEAEAGVAAEHDLTATPSFGLYASETDRSTQLVGAQPYDRFRDAIDSLAP